MRPITERLSPTVRQLIIASALVYAFYVMVPRAQPLFANHLALGPGAARGELWQVATSLFVHLDFVGFVFNVIGLWFVGAAIERSAGRRKFLSLFFVPALAGNIAVVAVSPIIGMDGLFAGCSHAILAMFVAFGRMFARTQARVFGAMVMEARTLSMVLVGFALFADLANMSVGRLVCDLVAVTLAYLMCGGRGQSLRVAWKLWRKKGVRRPYQVIDGGRRPPFVN